MYVRKYFQIKQILIKANLNNNSTLKLQICISNNNLKTI